MKIEFSSIDGLWYFIPTISFDTDYKAFGLHFLKWCMFISMHKVKW